MGYRLTHLGDDVYAGIARDGSLNIEVWYCPKPAHAVASDYEEFCDEVVIPASAAEQLFELLR